MRWFKCINISNITGLLHCSFLSPSYCMGRFWKLGQFILICWLHLWTLNLTRRNNSYWYSKFKVIMHHFDPYSIILENWRIIYWYHLLFDITTYQRKIYFKQLRMIILMKLDVLSPGVSPQFVQMRCVMSLFK